MKSKKDLETNEREFFDNLAEIKKDTWWGNKTIAGMKRLEKRAHIIKNKLIHCKDPLVLELGCGTGSFSKFILQEIPSLTLIGCDISPKCIKLARENCSNFPNATFQVASATLITHNANKFNAVIGNSILHHIKEIDTALSECSRVLESNGLICFFEPNMMNPQVALERNIPLIRKLLQNTKDETAFFRWSLAKKLRKTGFQNISIQPFDFLHPLVPPPLITITNKLWQLFEKTPIIKEISGSLLISARKPNT